MSNSNRNKGKRGESHFCALLGEIFGMNFTRNFTSGAIIGGSNAHRASKLTKEQELVSDGDIIVPACLGHISFECKNYQTFDWHLLYRGVYPLLDGWINQSSHSHRPMWLLMIKITRRGLWVCYDTNQIKGAKQNENRMVYQGKYVIESAETFLKNNSELLIQLGKQDEI